MACLWQLFNQPWLNIDVVSVPSISLITKEVIWDVVFDIMLSPIGTEYIISKLGDTQDGDDDTEDG